jgi:hypothetical protein
LPEHQKGPGIIRQNIFGGAGYLPSAITNRKGRKERQVIEFNTFATLAILAVKVISIPSPFRLAVE